MSTHRVSPAHLVLAARQGNLQTVRGLCEQDDACAGKADDAGETALQLAAHGGHEEMVRVLLASGATATIDLAAPKELLTPLHLAVARGHAGVVRILLDCQPNVEALDARRYTPLHHAAFKGYGQIASMLVRAGARGTGRPQQRRQDQDEDGDGAGVYEDNDDGGEAAPPAPSESPLAISAYMRHADVALVLMLEAGADPATIPGLADRAWAEQLLVAHEREERRAHLEEEERRACEQRQGRPGSSSREPLRPSSALLPRTPLRPRPLTPVYVPPAPLDLDEGEALLAGRGGKGLGGSQGPAVWFVIHDEPLVPIAADDDELSRGNELENLALYRAPAQPQQPAQQQQQQQQQGLSSSLPTIGGAGNRGGAGSGGPGGGGGASGGGPAPKASSENRILHLYPIPYLGVASGFLLDEEQRFVFYLDPLLQKWVLEAQAQQHPRSRPFPFAPHFVGRWEGSGKATAAAGGVPTGYVKPVADEWACMLLESYGGCVKRCLRHNSAAAAWVGSRSGITADFASSSAGGDSRVSLVVPLCAILGVHELSELAQLTESDLHAGFMDTKLLEPLLRALSALGMSQDAASGGAAPQRPQTATSRPGTANGGAKAQLVASARPSTARATRRPGTANGKRTPPRGDGGAGGDGSGGGYDPESQPTPEQQLVSLLQEHALMKLLPLAAELRIVDDVSKWHLLATAAPIWQEGGALSRFETARLGALLASVKALQDAAMQRRLASLTRLVRLSVGSLVLYDANGKRGLGLVIDDLGEGAGRQFKVRDLLNDEMIWAAPGQLTRVSRDEAMRHLRADLLPPATSGPPVLPYTAFAGAPVQLAYDFWSRDSGDKDGAPPDGAALQQGLDARSARAVVGIMVESASPDGTSWRVRWPDGTVCLHATGADGRFELAHFTLHRAAGAPLSRAHVGGLLMGQDVGLLPVVRSPLWSRPTTDDEVPGSVGVGLLEAGQTVLQVVWGCSICPRDNLPMYSPDGLGIYQLCHGLVPGQPLNMYTAKEAVPVEDDKGRRGVLMAPIALAAGGSDADGTGAPGVTWRVQWDGGNTSDRLIGDASGDATAVAGLGSASGPLRVSHTFHVEKQLDRVRLLNEVPLRQTPGCVPASGCCQPKRTTCAMGRAAFWKGPTAHVVGAMSAEDQPLLLGQLVKINRAVAALQPGAEDGPMACYDVIDVPTLMRARREGRLTERLPADDVGVVVRDLGPGTWRGVLVRKYGASKSFYYDETVLLPACQQDVMRQAQRQRSPFYVMPRTMQGVPVTDGNAAAGMLVQRAFREGAAMQSSDKSTMIGVLVSQPAPLTWLVRWPDGTTRPYKTGYRGQFQLCFAQSSIASGSPLMHATVQETAAQQRRIAVTDGMFVMNSPCPPGTVRWVNDQQTQQGVRSGEARLLEAVGLVLTSVGERMFAGGPLQLYELAHAIVPGAPLTIFTAKKGIRVELHTTGVEDVGQVPVAPVPVAKVTAGGEDGEEADAVSAAAEPAAAAPPPPSKVGTLHAPVRLVTTAVKKAGNAKGVQQESGNGDRFSVVDKPAATLGDNFYRTPNGRVVSGEEILSSAERSPQWLYGEYRLPGTQKSMWEHAEKRMTGKELCESIERMHTAKTKKKKSADDAGAGLSEAGRDALAQELYSTRVIGEEDDGKIVRVAKTAVNGQELWLPVNSNAGGDGNIAAGGAGTGGSGGGDGSASGGADGTAAKLPRELVDASKVVWSVAWDDGSVGEYVVGTEAAHSCLKIASRWEGDDALTEPPPQLYPPEHFVRMLEPVLLIDSGSRHRNKHLARLADALQSALQWHNQLLRELVNVWWSSAPLMAQGAMFRPQVELLDVQPDSLSLFLQGRVGPHGPWQALEQDEDNQVADRIDGRADADLAQAVQTLVRALGSLPSGLHLIPSEDPGAGLLDDAYMIDGSGRTVEAPAELVPLLTAVNEASRRLRASLVDSDPVDEDTLALEVGCAIEPAMGGVAPPAPRGTGGPGPFALGRSGLGEAPAAPGGDAATQTPAMTRVLVCDGEVLMPVTPGTAARRAAQQQQQQRDSGDEASAAYGGQGQGQAGDGLRPTGSSLMLAVVRQPIGESQEPLLADTTAGVMPVGPGMMLTLGCASQLRRGLQGVQRCLGALAGSSLPLVSSLASWGGAPPGRRNLLLVGTAPCLWLEAVELEAITGCLPRDLPLARCRAAVNIHLFDMWKTCARAFVEGTGSADISHCLLKLLQVIHSKAQAALAADASTRWANASVECGATCNEMMKQLHNYYAGDVQTFAANTAKAMLLDIRYALGSLHFVQEAATTAHELACSAVVSSEVMFEQDDLDVVEEARKRAGMALEACAVCTRNTFPNMAEAAVSAAEHVVADMHTNLLAADAALHRALSDRQAAAAVTAACDKENRDAATAQEEAKAKYDHIASKLKDLINAHQQQRAERESLVASRAAAERALKAWTTKAEGCSIKGQASLLRQRLELMLEASASADKLSQQLRALAAGSGGGAAPHSKEALAMLTLRVEELLQWATDYESVSGFTLDAEVKRALSVLRSKVEVVVASIQRELAEGATPLSDDEKTLELLKQVAELGRQAADRVGASEVKQANEQVLQAIQDAAAKAEAGAAAAGPTGLLADIEPASEAATHFVACLRTTITAWAAFSMQLNKEAAKETSLSEVTAKLDEQLASEVEKQRLAVLGSASGADMLQRQQQLSEGTTGITVASVLAAADKEEKAAKKHLEEAQATVATSEEMLVKIEAATRKLWEDLAGLAAEAAKGEEAVAGKKGAATETVRRGAEMALGAEMAMWDARRTAPASGLDSFVLPPGEPKESTHAKRAEAAVSACGEALSVLAAMRAGVPAALRSPEAADRMVAGCAARVAASAARAAAEWARTAALGCEGQLADQEWYDRVTGYLAALDKRQQKDQVGITRLEEGKLELNEQIRALLQDLARVHREQAPSEPTPEALHAVEALVNHGANGGGASGSGEQAQAGGTGDGQQPAAAAAAGGEAWHTWTLCALPASAEGQQVLLADGQPLMLDVATKYVYSVPESDGGWPRLEGLWDGGAAGGEFQYAKAEASSAAARVFVLLDRYLKENKVRFKEMFDKYDTSAKDNLTFEELGQLVRDLDPSPSEGDLRFLEVMADANQDGHVTMPEFLATAQMLLQEEMSGGRGSVEGDRVLESVRAFLKAQRDSVEELFEQFDGDADGLLEPKELLLMLKEGMPELQPRELRYVIARMHEVDLEHNGLTSLHTLLVTMRAVKLVLSEEQAPSAVATAQPQAPAARSPRESFLSLVSEVQEQHLPWDKFVEAFRALDLASALEVYQLLPPPPPLTAGPLDDACAAASGQLASAVHVYFAVRPQVDPTVDLGLEDAAVLRALVSAFGMLDQVARQAAEAAEQQVAAAGGAAGAASGGGGAKAPVDSSQRVDVAEALHGPFAAPQAVLHHNGEAAQAAEALAALGQVAVACAQALPPDLGGRLEAAAKAAKSAANAAKRSQIAATRAVGEGVKQLGPPAFASGVLATTMARLAKDEPDMVKSLRWTHQAADVFRGAVTQDMHAAMAACEPAPPKPRADAEGDDGGGGGGAAADAALEAAEAARAAALAKQQRLEQQDKERAIMAFVGRTAVEVAEAACDAGGKLDLSSYMAPNDDEVTSTYVESDDLVAAAMQAASVGPSGGAAAATATGDGADAGDGAEADAAGQQQPPSERATAAVDETLVKMCHALSVVRAANDALALAGGHPDVKKIEGSLDDCLRSYTNVPKMQAGLLDKLTAQCEEDVADAGGARVDEAQHAQLLKLMAYEQVVTAAVRVCDQLLDAARLITVSVTTEENLASAKHDLLASRGRLGALLALPGAPDLSEAMAAGQEAAAAAALQQQQSLQPYAGEFGVKLQVLLAACAPGSPRSNGGVGSRPGSALPTTPPGARRSLAPHPGDPVAPQAWDLVVGFAPPPGEEPPLAAHIEAQDPRQAASAEELLSAQAWADASSQLLGQQLNVVQERCAPELTARLRPAQNVLARPALARQLQPYVTLLDACNRALAAVAVAEPCRPDDGLLLSAALLGAPDVRPATAATNFNQFRRWDIEVQNMHSTARLVLLGFCKAQAIASAVLPEITVQALPQPPPQPRGNYRLEHDKGRGASDQGQ